MPDVPFRDEPERDEVFADKLVALRDRMDAAARVTLTGDSTGRIRRKVLFVVIGVSLVLGVGAVGIIALLALAMTDDVVTLG